MHQLAVRHGGADGLLARVRQALADDATPRLLPASGAAVQPHDDAQLERLRAGELTSADVLRELQASGLRGLGGAGFAAWRKWATVAGQPGPRHGVVNIDEGEVGTFKDWHLLAHDPRPALEGMLIAAAVVGVDHWWLYVRDEYPDVRAWLAQELQQLRQRLAHWQQRYPQAFGDAPGAGPRGTGALLPAGGPTIELRRGAGASICGEESALIESIEGKRGLPRLRPPITAVRGVFGRPTLAHNVETLWWLPTLLREGGAAWAAGGVRGRQGRRAPTPGSWSSWRVGSGWTGITVSIRKAGHRSRAAPSAVCAMRWRA